MNANEKRQKVCETYSIILGRNIYNQDLRDFCFTPYKDGNYYSDCSSSISYSYKKAGFSFGILNTADMYYNLATVPNLAIKNGIPVDVSLLRKGDMFLFAGNDASRPRCIGHVEMVYDIKDGVVTLCGHGSDTPSTKDMIEYCTWRYNKWASGGWRKGLVCVKRFIEDDTEDTKIKEGWIQEDNAWKYYENDIAVSSKWIQSEDKKDWYYIDENTIMATNKWVKSADGNDWYYLGEDGKMLKSCTKNINGWEQDFDKDGKWIKYTAWHNDRFYNGDTNMYVRNDWVQFGKDWSWFDDNGHKVSSTWVKAKNGSWYYIKDDGIMQLGGTVDWKGKTYHLNSDGSCKD
jgi:glucan-binding YG repeat protein